MAKRADNFDESLVKRGDNPLAMNAPGQTIAELCAEGDRMLAAEGYADPKSSSNKSLETSLGEKSSNPYIRARAQVLKSMKRWQQKEIETLESSGQTDKLAYQEFVKSVIEIGDKLSS
jgi:hypothetical protein